MGAAASVKVRGEKVAGASSTYAMSIEPKIMDEYRLNYRAIRPENDSRDQIGHESLMQLLRSLCAIHNLMDSSVRHPTSLIETTCRFSQYGFSGSIEASCSSNLDLIFPVAYFY